jgi:hypothetical protein
VAALAKVLYESRSDASAAANNDNFHFLVYMFDLSVWFRLAEPQPLSLREMMCYFFLQLPESRISENNELSFETTCGAGSKIPRE